jgi:hypothetical protein
MWFLQVSNRPSSIMSPPLPPRQTGSDGGASDSSSSPPRSASFQSYPSSLDSMEPEAFSSSTGTTSSSSGKKQAQTQEQSRQGESQQEEKRLLREQNQREVHELHQKHRQESRALNQAHKKQHQQLNKEVREQWEQQRNSPSEAFAEISSSVQNTTSEGQHHDSPAQLGRSISGHEESSLRESLHDSEMPPPYSSRPSDKEKGSRGEKRKVRDDGDDQPKKE